MRNISHTKTKSVDGLQSAGKGLHQQVQDKLGNKVANPKFEAYTKHLPKLIKAYSTYDNLTMPCCLESLSPMILPKAEGDAISELFERKRPFIEALWQEVAYENDAYLVCPLCGQKTVTDLDHYVPRSIMSEYSVHFLNLIPVCHECNVDKGDKWLDDAGRRLIFNAYFDSGVDVSNLLGCQLRIVSSVEYPQVVLFLDAAAIKAAGNMGKLVESTYKNIENIRTLWRQKASSSIKNKTNEIIKSISVHKRLGKYANDQESWDIQKEVLKETLVDLHPHEFIEKVVYQTMLSSPDYEKWLLGKLKANDPHAENYSIKLACKECASEFEIDLSTYDLDWERIETEERDMGAEIHHQAVLEIECPDCDEPISLSLDAWEYPVGIFNTLSIDVDGATIVGDTVSLNGLAPIGEVE